MFITRTFSKDASLAGLRVGYGIGSPKLMAVINAVKNSVNPYNVDSISEAWGLQRLSLGTTMWTLAQRL